MDEWDAPASCRQDIGRPSEHNGCFPECFGSAICQLGCAGRGVSYPAFVHRLSRTAKEMKDTTFHGTSYLLSSIVGSGEDRAPITLRCSFSKDLLGVG